LVTKNFVPPAAGRIAGSIRMFGQSRYVCSVKYVRMMCPCGTWL
jgi:hypothetical protein